MAANSALSRPHRLGPGRGGESGRAALRLCLVGQDAEGLGCGERGPIATFSWDAGIRCSAFIADDQFIARDVGGYLRFLRLEGPCAGSVQDFWRGSAFGSQDGTNRWTWPAPVAGAPVLPPPVPTAPLLPWAGSILRVPVFDISDGRSVGVPAIGTLVIAPPVSPGPASPSAGTGSSCVRTRSLFLSVRFTPYSLQLTLTAGSGQRSARRIDRTWSCRLRIPTKLAAITTLKFDNGRKSSATNPCI